MGAYTGNAIASIACSERVAVVDANVVRVLARLRRLAGDPKQAAKLHARLAEELLDPARPGDFNQVCCACHGAVRLLSDCVVEDCIRSTSMPLPSLWKGEKARCQAPDLVLGRP